MFGGAGAFWATRALEVVKRNDSPGLLWKRIKLTTTRKNNAKKRLKRLWQVNQSPHGRALPHPLSSPFTFTPMRTPPAWMNVSCGGAFW
jgi:hypothetical protein